jgi:hypothetical protein
MPDIPQFIDDFIAFLKREWSERWTEWYEYARSIGVGSPSHRHLSGLSPEEAGRRLLADCWPGPFDDYSKPLLLDHHTWIYDTLGRAVPVFRAGEWRLIDSSGKPLPPDRITPESFKFNPADIVFVRLIKTQAQAPTPHVIAPAPQEYRPATPARVHGKLKTVFETAYEKGDPISARDAAGRVRPQLNADGYDMSLRQIQQLGLQPQYKSLRRPSGLTRKSKRPSDRARKSKRRHCAS